MLILKCTQRLLSPWKKEYLNDEINQLNCWIQIWNRPIPPEFGSIHVWWYYWREDGWELWCRQGETVWGYLMLQHALLSVYLCICWNLEDDHELIRPPQPPLVCDDDEQVFWGWKLKVVRQRKSYNVRDLVKLAEVFWEYTMCIAGVF